MKNDNFAGLYNFNDFCCVVLYCTFLSSIMPKIQSHNGINTIHENLNLIYNFVNSPLSMEQPIKCITPTEIKDKFNNLTTNRSTGYNSIINKILKQLLSCKSIFFITVLQSVILLRLFNIFP